MKNLQGKFRELTYSELLKMNGGYSSSSGGSSRGYSGTSGGGNSCSSGGNTTVTPVGKPTFVRRDKNTLTTSRKNSDGSETYTTVNTKTGAVISSHTIGLRKGSGSKTNSTTGGNGGYSTSSSGMNGGGYSGTSSVSGTGRSGYGYSGTSGGSSSGTGSGNSQPKNNPINEPTTPGNSSSDFKHQICADPSKVHCDIIAWNHAVDAGLNPAGKKNKSWDGNELTVDAIFNNHYADEAAEFDSSLAGKKGYIFYDWTGDGTFDHMEYCEIENGGSYKYFSNNGFEQGETLVPQNFAKDKNAGALNGGPGKLKFVSLN